MKVRDPSELQFQVKEQLNHIMFIKQLIDESKRFAEKIIDK